MQYGDYEQAYMHAHGGGYGGREDSFFGNSPFGGYEGGPFRGREQRLYSRLMAEERYADLDKAKHNEQYRSYLLENFDDETPF